MKIFWSWQSDTHQKSGRYFVRDVLDVLVKELNTLEGTEEAERGDDIGPIEVDHDTKNVAGSPPIAATILEKIRDAAVFVADVTPVGLTPNGKHLPNPNVMIELGYAIRALGLNRIVLVMNKAAHSTFDTLPFDLRHLRGPVVYDLGEDPSPEQKQTQKEKLKSELRLRIKPSLQAAADALRESKRQRHPHPEFALKIVAAEGEMPKTITQKLTDLGVPTLAQVQERSPKLPVPAVDPEHTFRPNALMRSMALFHRIPPPSEWTRKETERYNEKLESYYLRYEKYLIELADHHRFQQRILQVKLKLINSGTAPGTNIDADLDIPEGLLLLKTTELPKPPRSPSPPPLDPDPVIRAYHQPSSWEGSYVEKRSEQAWTLVDPENRRVRFHVKELKHGYSIPSDTFAVAYATEDDIGNVDMPFVVSANELPEAEVDSISLEIMQAAE